MELAFKYVRLVSTNLPYQKQYASLSAHVLLCTMDNVQLWSERHVLVWLLKFGNTAARKPQTI